VPTILAFGLGTVTGFFVLAGLLVVLYIKGAKDDGY
jgi:hypothetical protein